MRIPPTPLILLLLHLLFPATLPAQQLFTRAAHDMQYQVEAQLTAGSDHTPLWFLSNRYGASSIEGSNGSLRFALTRAATDSTHHWNLNYGADFITGYHQPAPFIIQQLYADLSYRPLHLIVGQKAIPMQLKHPTLSSGSQTLGINARPVPQIRLELPEYLNIAGRSHMVGIKGHIAYGMMTDGSYTANTLHCTTNYARRALYHSKAGYLKVGNEQRFPLYFEGGLEMATTFGGTIYNATTWNGTQSVPLHMGHSLRDFIDATFGLGSDATDGQGYANSAGNTLGSWLFRLTYQAPTWRIAAYYDHFFEDHSQLFFQYGWKDGLLGFEVSLPQNRFIDTFVYEWMRTTYQSGPIYHDHTTAIPDQISGVDNYYNHNLYAGWQHWGLPIGNPLFTSPLYNSSTSLTFTNNRFRAHHFGLTGTPHPTLRYRLLYSYEQSLGTYSIPYVSPRSTHSTLAELNFKPSHIGQLPTKGWEATLSAALDHGTLIGNNWGLSLTLRHTGLLR